MNRSSGTQRDRREPLHTAGSDCEVTQFLILPPGSTNPNSGIGQRSALLFDALKRIGPTTVVIAGQERVTGHDSLFPEALEIIGLPVQTFRLEEKSILGRIRYAISRLINPTSFFSTDPHFQSQLVKAIGTDGRSLIVFRYFKTWAKSGLETVAPGKGLIVVDIDDRDDLKLESIMRARLGSAVGPRVSRFFVRRTENSMTRKLSNASAIILAKEQDRFSDLDVIQVEIPNAPHSSPDDVQLRSFGIDPILLFVGNAHHQPNKTGVAWFISECWDDVHRQRPDARLRIVGIGDWSDLKDKFGHIQGVQFVGETDNLLQEYVNARAAICPIFEGAGTQIKLIEACSFRRPVVASKLSGEAFGPDLAALISPTDNPTEFADHCVRYLMDTEEASRVGLALRTIQKARFSRSSSVEKAVDLFLTLKTEDIATDSGRAPQLRKHGMHSERLGTAP